MDDRMDPFIYRVIRNRCISPESKVYCFGVRVDDFVYGKSVHNLPHRRESN